MTYEAVLRESLRLMFLGEDEQLRILTVDDLRAEPNYSAIVDAVPGAVDRAVAEIRRRGLTGHKLRLLGTYPAGLTEFGPEDLPQMDEVLAVRDQRGVVPYYYADGVLSVRTDRDGCRLTLSYVPVAGRFAWDKVKEEIGLDERLESLIPYYVKGDLFAQDEPGAAAEARNWFEAGLEQFERSKRSAMRQVRVRNVYGMTAYE